MTRLLSGAAAVGALAATAILAATPALAATATLHDPAGDAAGRGLDITSARLNNLDHRIVVRVAFVSDTRGDLIVSVDRRHGHGLRLISEHRPAGTDKNFVLAGSFSDMTAGRTTDSVRCPGFRVHWDTDASTGAATARLVMPQACLNGGDYGAVRFAVLTERVSDTDSAPDNASETSWISRG